MLAVVSLAYMGCDSNDETAPTVSSVSPNTGPADGGTLVTITGADFADGATVTFGGTPGITTNVVNSTTITVFTPASQSGPGSVDVQVENPEGGRGTLGGGFTYE